MSFINGTATSFTDLRDSLISGLVANGWSSSGPVVWKGSSYFELTVSATYLQIYGGTGQSGGVISGKSPYGARLGGSFMIFPVNYDIHVFANPDEAYLVVNYSTTYYQQISFGTSSIEGAGYGPWFTGPSNTAYGPGPTNGMNIETAFTRIYGYSYISVSPMSFGLFNAAILGGEVGSSFVYTNANGTLGWYGFGSGATSSRLHSHGAPSIVAGLLNCSPGAFNSGTILLPIKATLDMGSNGKAVVACPTNARYCRIDNLTPGDIINFGSDEWKIYPWLSKNEVSRNGASAGTSPPPNHSGTFGFAVKYQGV